MLLHGRKSYKNTLQATVNKGFLQHRPNITYSDVTCAHNLRHTIPPALEQWGIMYSIYTSLQCFVCVMYSLLPPQYYTG